MGQRGREARAAWMAKFEDYQRQFPQLADHLSHMQQRQLPEGWDKDLPVFPADAKGVAGRDASSKVLNALAKNVPWLLGGSADLAPSTKTRLTFEGAGDFTAKDRGGRNLHFGVREHAMGSVLNGLSLSKVRPYGSGFLIFSDYSRGAIRLSALMEIPVIHIFTHDSIGVGEDGPTHQPIEQLASLRAIPNLIVLRPADANEVSEAWRVIMQMQHEPVALILTRQALPTIDRIKYAAASGVAKGAYVLADAPGGKPDVLLLASGSEVSLCLEAGEKLKAKGIRGPRGEHALLGTIRASIPRIPRQRDSSNRHGTGLRGTGLHVWMGDVCRADRRDHRYDIVWRLGSSQRTPKEIRVHRRQRRGRSNKADSEARKSRLMFQRGCLLSRATSFISTPMKHRQGRLRHRQLHRVVVTSRGGDQ